MKRNAVKKEMTSTKLTRKVYEIFENRGREAFDAAKKSVSLEHIRYDPAYEAIRYFMEESWYGIMHPALIHLACEAAGGKGEETVKVGAAIVLISGAVDIHDDIIDNSNTKNSKPTVLGKFGKELATLVGDALLFRGLTSLYWALEDFSFETRKNILDLIENAFFEIGRGEAKEKSVKGRLDLHPDVFFEIIKMKATVEEAYGRIGAILARGEQKKIEAFGRLGKTLGILAAIRDDFVDMFEPDELKNRLRNECLPLPLLYALQDEKLHDKIVRILEKQKITEKDAYNLVDIVWETEQVQSLREKMYVLIGDATRELGLVENKKAFGNLKTIIDSMMEDLE